MRKTKVKITEMNPSSTKKSVIAQLRQTITETVTLSGDWLGAAPEVENTRDRVAFARIALAEAGNYQIGQELDGHIYVKEKLTPFFEDQEPKKRPVEDVDDSEWPVLTSDGKPIYRKSFYDVTGTKADELIEHDGEMSSVEELPKLDETLALELG